MQGGALAQLAPRERMTSGYVLQDENLKEKDVKLFFLAKNKIPYKKSKARHDKKAKTSTKFKTPEYSGKPEIALQQPRPDKTLIAREGKISEKNGTNVYDKTQNNSKEEADVSENQQVLPTSLEIDKDQTKGIISRWQRAIEAFENSHKGETSTELGEKRVDMKPKDSLLGGPEKHRLTEPDNGTGSKSMEKPEKGSLDGRRWPTDETPGDDFEKSRRRPFPPRTSHTKRIGDGSDKRRTVPLPREQSDNSEKELVSSSAQRNVDFNPQKTQATFYLIRQPPDGQEIAIEEETDDGNVSLNNENGPRLTEEKEKQKKKNYEDQEEEEEEEEENDEEKDVGNREPVKKDDAVKTTNTVNAFVEPAGEYSPNEDPEIRTTTSDQHKVGKHLKFKFPEDDEHVQDERGTAEKREIEASKSRGAQRPRAELNKGKDGPNEHSSIESYDSRLSPGVKNRGRHPEENVEAQSSSSISKRQNSPAGTSQSPGMNESPGTSKSSAESSTRSAKSGQLGSKKAKVNQRPEPTCDSVEAGSSTNGAPSPAFHPQIQLVPADSFLTECLLQSAHRNQTRNRFLSVPATCFLNLSDLDPNDRREEENESKRTENPRRADTLSTDRNNKLRLDSSSQSPNHPLGKTNDRSSQKKSVHQKNIATEDTPDGPEGGHDSDDDDDGGRGDETIHEKEEENETLYAHQSELHDVRTGSSTSLHSCTSMWSMDSSSGQPSASVSVSSGGSKETVVTGRASLCVCSPPQKPKCCPASGVTNSCSNQSTSVAKCRKSKAVSIQKCAPVCRIDSDAFSYDSGLQKCSDAGSSLACKPSCIVRRQSTVKCKESRRRSNSKAKKSSLQRITSSYDDGGDNDDDDDVNDSTMEGGSCAENRVPERRSGHEHVFGRSASKRRRNRGRSSKKVALTTTACLDKYCWNYNGCNCYPSPVDNVNDFACIGLSTVNSFRCPYDLIDCENLGSGSGLGESIFEQEFQYGMKTMHENFHTFNLICDCRLRGSTGCVDRTMSGPQRLASPLGRQQTPEPMNSIYESGFQDFTCCLDRTLLCYPELQQRTLEQKDFGCQVPDSTSLKDSNIAIRRYADDKTYEDDDDTEKVASKERARQTLSRDQQTQTDAADDNARENSTSKRRVEKEQTFQNVRILSCPGDDQYARTTPLVELPEGSESGEEVQYRGSSARNDCLSVGKIVRRQEMRAMSQASSVDSWCEEYTKKTVPKIVIHFEEDEDQETEYADEETGEETNEETEEDNEEEEEEEDQDTEREEEGDRETDEEEEEEDQEKEMDDILLEVSKERRKGGVVAKREDKKIQRVEPRPRIDRTESTKPKTVESGRKAKQPVYTGTDVVGVEHWPVPISPSSSVSEDTPAEKTPLNPVDKENIKELTVEEDLLPYTVPRSPEEDTADEDEDTRQQEFSKPKSIIHKRRPSVESQERDKHLSVSLKVPSTENHRFRQTADAAADDTLAQGRPYEAALEDMVERQRPSDSPPDYDKGSSKSRPHRRSVTWKQDPVSSRSDDVRGDETESREAETSDNGEKVQGRGESAARAPAKRWKGNLATAEKTKTPSSVDSGSEPDGSESSSSSVKWQTGYSPMAVQEPRGSEPRVEPQKDSGVEPSPVGLVASAGSGIVTGTTTTTSSSSRSSSEHFQSASEDSDRPTDEELISSRGESDGEQTIGREEGTSPSSSSTAFGQTTSSAESDRSREYDDKEEVAGRRDEDIDTGRKVDEEANDRRNEGTAAGSRDAEAADGRKDTKEATDRKDDEIDAGRKDEKAAADRRDEEIGAGRKDEEAAAGRRDEEIDAGRKDEEVDAGRKDVKAAADRRDEEIDDGSVGEEIDDGSVGEEIDSDRRDEEEAAGKFDEAVKIEENLERRSDGSKKTRSEPNTNENAVESLIEAKRKQENVRIADDDFDPPEFFDPDNSAEPSAQNVKELGYTLLAKNSPTLLHKLKTGQLSPNQDQEEVGLDRHKTSAGVEQNDADKKPKVKFKMPLQNTNESNAATRGDRRPTHRRVRTSVETESKKERKLINLDAKSKEKVSKTDAQKRSPVGHFENQAGKLNASKKSKPKSVLNGSKSDVQKRSATGPLVRNASDSIRLQATGNGGKSTESRLVPENRKPKNSVSFIVRRNKKIDSEDRVKSNDPKRTPKRDDCGKKQNKTLLPDVRSDNEHVQTKTLGVHEIGELKMAAPTAGTSKFEDQKKGDTIERHSRQNDGEKDQKIFDRTEKSTQTKPCQCFCRYICPAARLGLSRDAIAESIYESKTSKSVSDRSRPLPTKSGNSCPRRSEKSSNHIIRLVKSHSKELNATARSTGPHKEDSSNRVHLTLTESYKAYSSSRVNSFLYSLRRNSSTLVSTVCNLNRSKASVNTVNDYRDRKADLNNSTAKCRRQCGEKKTYAERFRDRRKWTTRGCQQYNTSLAK